MVYFDQMLDTYACQHFLTNVMRNSIFMDEALLCISPIYRGHVVKMLITLEPHDIFGSNFVYLFILTSSNHWYAKP